MIEELNTRIKEYGLTPEQYEACLRDASAKVNHTIDIDWQDIIEKYGLDIHYDTLRKATQTIFGGAFVSDYFKAKMSEKTANDSYLKEMRAESHAIRKEKQKLFDERAELNRQLRNQARIENDLCYLESLIKSRSMKELPIHNHPNISSDNDLFICISDLHYGATFDNRFGKYNTTIAVDRLAEYYDRIIDIQNRHNSENAYVALLGDLINGEIHFTTQLENREMLIEQLQGAAELLSDFIYALSKKFKNVYVNGVAGNHSRTSFKDQVLRGNRLDNIIPWYMKAKLQHIENVIFLDDDNYDSTIGNICARNKQYAIVHGDWDSFNEAGVSKLVMMLGFKPTAIFMGHMHHNSYDEVSSDIQMIRSGSFSGSGDDYCVSKRISGTACQMVSVIDDSGIQCCYPIRFNR